ncbi:MAG: TonB-dependent receptor, partial [Pirellulaceae bacterium]|nr:TonB-dependent receptor [Pirellulaceae bacterium]
FGTRREAFPGNVRQRNNPLASGQIATATGASPYPDCPVMSDQLRPEDIHAVGDGSCAYTLTGLNFVTISDEEQYTLASQLSKRIANEHTLSLQFYHAWSDITRERPWPRIQGRNIPLESPYYPGNGIVPAIVGQDLTSPVQTYGMSMVALERPEETVTDRTWRLMASLDGVIGAFDYEVWALQSEAEFEQAIASYDNRWIDGIDRRDDDTAPWINPWADFAGQSPEAQAWISGNFMGKVKDRIADSQLRNIGISLGRDIEQIDLGAGAAALAFAFEYTEEELFTGLSLERLAATNQTPEVRLGPDRNTSGDRDLYSATLEVLLPITEALEVSASVRYDDYSDVGDTTNPKLLINYDVTSNFNLHASFGTGFRAPTLVDVFRARSLVGTIPANPQIFDRNLCTDGVTPNDPQDDPFNVCDIRVNRITGGNLDLKPEESETFAIGTEISFDHDQTGFGNIAIAVDYWDYTVDDVINAGIAPDAIFADWNQFASGFIFRCSTFTEEEIDGLNNCPDDPALRFNDYIGAVLQTNVNIGVLETSGIDFKFLWDLPTDIGDWSFTYNATYVDDYDQEVYDGAGVQSRVNEFISRSFGPVLEFKHYATLRWSNYDWAAFLQHQYQSGYDDCGSVCGRPDRKVDSHGIFNIGGSYRFGESVTVNLRVENLLQNDPPFTNNSGAGSITTANTDVRYFDHIGRRVGLTLTANFE